MKIAIVGVMLLLLCVTIGLWSSVLIWLLWTGLDETAWCIGFLLPLMIVILFASLARWDAAWQVTSRPMNNGWELGGLPRFPKH